MRHISDRARGARDELNISLAGHDCLGRLHYDALLDGLAAAAFSGEAAGAAHLQSARSLAAAAVPAVAGCTRSGAGRAAPDGDLDHASFAPVASSRHGGRGFLPHVFCAQWVFADFLLTDLADNRFFAGGGRHWPFFLKIDAASRVEFWRFGNDDMDLAGALAAAGLSVLAARLGLWLGAWMKIVRR